MENDSVGEETLQIIDRGKYTIRIVKQNKAEKNLDGLYKTIAQLLYEQATEK
jgi:hypothetical protein